MILNKIIAFSFLVLALSSCSGPKALFSVANQETEAPARIKFQNESLKAESYKWDFGDGKTSEEENPDYRYMMSGRYTVSLTAKMKNKTSKTKKEIIVSAPDQCLIQIETSMGTMIARLYDETPEHRDNFIKLANEGYFNDLLFHRVIDGFMVQGGDPNSRNAGMDVSLGAGGPNYKVDAEMNEKFVHVKGALAAARQGDQVNPEKKSSGSQFYIVHGGKQSQDQLNMMEARKGITYTPEAREKYETEGGTPFLDMEYTVFGEVIEGLDIIDKIAAVQTTQMDRPLENITMKISVIK